MRLGEVSEVLSFHGAMNHRIPSSQRQISGKEPFLITMMELMDSMGSPLSDALVQTIMAYMTLRVTFGNGLRRPIMEIDKWIIAARAMIQDNQG